MERKPALGLSLADYESMLLRFNHPTVSAAQKRRAFRILMSYMLNNVISCNGVSTFEGLVAVLMDEIKRGIPAPIPSWFEQKGGFSTVRWGSRRLGYYSCDTRGCFTTEHEGVIFSLSLIPRSHPIRFGVIRLWWL